MTNLFTPVRGKRVGHGLQLPRSILIVRETENLSFRVGRFPPRNDCLPGLRSGDGTDDDGGGVGGRGSLQGSSDEEVRGVVQVCEEGFGSCPRRRRGILDLLLVNCVRCVRRVENTVSDRIGGKQTGGERYRRKVVAYRVPSARRAWGKRSVGWTELRRSIPTYVKRPWPNKILLNSIQRD